jgi:hypothetical protein
MAATKISHTMQGAFCTAKRVNMTYVTTAAMVDDSDTEVLLRKLG